MFTLIRPRTRSSATLVGLLVGTLAAACGSKTPTSPDGPGGPAPGSAPTAALTNSNATATALATEAKGILSMAQKAQQIPTAINLAAVPAGAVVVTPCTAGGNITYDYPSTFSAGTKYTTTYNNCQFLAGYTTNGTITVTYSSFSNSGNFSWTAAYNMTSSGSGYSFTYSGSQTCNYVSSVASCYYSESGRTLEATFNYNIGNNLANGTYTWTYGELGTVRYTLTNWGPTSGSIQVLGANNTSAAIVRTGANSYSVTINGGTPYTLTL